MNHLDEGTIHAWLDGALDAVQARDVESHVAACGACAERVAEARGLIAGASRILGALDDVPGGVLPAGSRAAPAAAPTAVPVRPIARPRRWATPWVTGVAAILVAAVVLRTSESVRRGESAADLTARASMDTVRALIEAPSPVANAPAAPTSVARDQAGAERTSAPASAGAVGGVSGAVAAPERRARQEAAGAGAAGAPLAATREERLRFAEPGAQPPPPPVPAAAPPAAPLVARGVVIDAQKAAAEEITVTSAATTDAMGVAHLAGCYVVPVLAVNESALAAPATQRRAESARSARPQPAAASAGAASVARGDIAGGRLVVFTMLPADSATPGFVARDLAGDTSVGSWSAVDSARVELRLRTGQRVVMPAATRTPCPPR